MTDNAATSTSTNVYRIEPLTRAENYAVWKIKMIDILTGQDLWEYVDETTILPTDTASQSGWRKKDRLALSMIRLRVADKMLVYVASLTSAREAWETLNSLLEAQGALGIVLARRKLFRAQCAEGTTIEEHIRTVKINGVLPSRTRRLLFIEYCFIRRASATSPFYLLFVNTVVIPLRYNGQCCPFS